MPSLVRIGFIGLSADKSGWANVAHYPYLAQSSHYKIVALCNSSIESARDSIVSHGLDPSTKAYDNPEQLAADPDIDLVVVSVKVNQHFRLIHPALLAGKDVFVEWPLGANLAEAEELLRLAKLKNVRHVVGLEEPLTPGVKAIKTILDQGRIGKVLSSSVWVVGMYMGEAPLEPRQEYSADIKSGGNLVTINTMHVLESVVSVLGELESWTPLIANQRPQMTVQRHDGTKTSIVKTTHDQVVIQGIFESGAILSFHLRGGGPFKGTPGMTWRIYGEKGELSIEGDAFGLSLGTPLNVRLHDFETGQVEKLEVINSVEEWQRSNMPPMAQMMGLVYEAFYRGEGYSDWELAVRRHRMIDEIYARGTK